MPEEKGKTTVSLQWKLRKAMADANVWKTSDLAERLGGLGVNLSAPNVSRLINRMPQRLSMKVLAALMTTLDCDITDIIEVVRHPAGEGGTGGGKEGESRPEEPPAKPEPQKTERPPEPKKTPEPKKPKDAKPTAKGNGNVRFTLIPAPPLPGGPKK